jgi:hypothetical protein
VVGIGGLLWSAMGALDFVMTQTRNERYLSAFTPEQLTFFYSLPTWAIATWAIAVWGGVVGAIFLLLRKRVAVLVFYGCHFFDCFLPLFILEGNAAQGCSWLKFKGLTPIN